LQLPVLLTEFLCRWQRHILKVKGVVSVIERAFVDGAIKIELMLTTEATCFLRVNLALKATPKGMFATTRAGSVPLNSEKF
jgi:hypothetical protein